MNPIRSFCTSFRFFVGPFSGGKKHWGMRIFISEFLTLFYLEILKGLNLNKLVWGPPHKDMNRAGHLLKFMLSSIPIRVALCNILCFVIFSGNRNRRHNRCWTRVLPDCTLPRTLPQYLCLLDTTQDTAARPDWWHQGIHYGDTWTGTEDTMPLFAWQCHKM